MKIRKIGIVGSGRIGGNLGVLLARAGYEVFFSSRHPDMLAELVKTAGHGARAGSAAGAIAFGDVVILSLPFRALPELDDSIKGALKGKIVIDTSNPYPQRDGTIADEARKEPGGMGVVVSRLLPGARVVRAFNTVYFDDLKRTVNKAGEKIGIPVAGDDAEAVDAAVELAQSAGLDPVVTGGLGTSRSFDVGSEVYATSASAAEIRRKLKTKSGAARRAA